MNKIYVIIFIFSTLIIYNLINLYLCNKNARKVTTNNNSIFSKNIHIISYKKKIEQNLFNLGNPYKLNLKKYLIIKYVISPIVFLVAYLNYNNIVISLIMFLITFYFINFLIYMFKKEENVKIINEIKNLNLNLILYLSCYTPLKEALIKSINSLTYERIIGCFKRFVYVYELNGYNLTNALKVIEEKFSSYELNMFLNILRQGEKEGKLVENLERFDETLELSYFKYLKRQSEKQLIYIVFGIMASLGSMSLVVIYPMVIDIMNNLQQIFS